MFASSAEGREAFWREAAAGERPGSTWGQRAGLGGGARRRGAQGAGPVALTRDPLRPDEELSPGDRICALGLSPATARRIGGRQDPSRRQARDSVIPLKEYLDLETFSFTGTFVFLGSILGMSDSLRFSVWDSCLSP